MYGGPLGPFGRIAKRTKVELRIQSFVTSLRPTWVTQVVRSHTRSPLYPRKMKLRVPLHPAHVIALLVALFASPVRSITPPWSPSLHQGTTDDLITYYFNAGHQYIKIVYFLCIVHGLVISMRQLKRKLKRLGLRRRAPKTAANFRHVCRLIWVRYIISNRV